ncbi:Uncharacterised protein [Serratia marcescens]|nr:Uncharacterised protein [Serratia marcescens]
MEIHCKKIEKMNRKTYKKPENKGFLSIWH